MSTLLIPSIRLFPTWKPAGGVAPVALRRIRPDDAAGLQGFVRALSPASRRLRFHGAVNELSEATLQALTCVDQRDHVAFVLTVTEHGTERIVGEARYAVSGDEEAAEFAIVVTDAFRGLGLAERLLAALLDAARTAGVRWLFGEVLVGNARMLAFMRRCGFAATGRGGLAPGFVRMERSVPDPSAFAHCLPHPSDRPLSQTFLRRLRRSISRLPGDCRLRATPIPPEEM